jgi:glucan phosphoethanolaminetransferase (alkaline phosphatase superfamily)
MKKSSKSENINPNKLLDYIGWSLLIAATLLLRVAERLLDNTVNARAFLKEYLIYGLLFSGVVLLSIYKINPNYFRSNEAQRGSAILSYLIGIMVSFIFMAAYLNFQTSKHAIKTSKAIVKEHYENYRYKTKYVVLHFEGQTERFQPPKAEWDRLSVNDTITLTIGEGCLGYDHLLTFCKNQ